MINALLVGAGGFLGAIARYLTGNLATRLWGTSYPYGTLIVNVAGSFLIGLASAWLLTISNTQAARMRCFIIAGFLGGFTTWSSFALEYTQMCKDTAYFQAAGYIALQIVLSLAAVFAGFWTARTQI